MNDTCDKCGAETKITHIALKRVPRQRLCSECATTEGVLTPDGLALATDVLLDGDFEQLTASV